MNIVKRIINKIKKKNDHFHVEGLPMSVVKPDIADFTNSKSERMATGSRSAALGINSKVTISGICRHPNRRHIDSSQLDGLPITESGWTHCIFYGNYDACYYGGNCDHCKRIFIKGGCNDPHVQQEQNSSK